MTTQDQTRAPRDWRGRRGRDERAPFWYVVFVQQQHELRIEGILEAMGFRVYLPCRTEYRHKNRFTKTLKFAKQEVRYPAFPGMLLIGFPFDPPAWKDLFDKNLIQGVMGLEGRPRRLRKSEVAQFREATHPDKLRAPDEQRHMRTHGEFAVNDLVSPALGPLKGQVFRVSEIHEEKAKILVELFGRPQHLEFRVDELEPVG